MKGHSLTKALLRTVFWVTFLGLSFRFAVGMAYTVGFMDSFEAMAELNCRNAYRRDPETHCSWEGVDGYGFLRDSLPSAIAHALGLKDSFL